MTEYITKEQALEIVQRHQWDFVQIRNEIKRLPAARVTTVAQVVPAARAAMVTPVPVMNVKWLEEYENG